MRRLSHLGRKLFGNLTGHRLFDRLQVLMRNLQMSSFLKKTQIPSSREFTVILRAAYPHLIHRYDAQRPP
jgi:hypothetical protein